MLKHSYVLTDLYVLKYYTWYSAKKIKNNILYVFFYWVFLIQKHYALKLEFHQSTFLFLNYHNRLVSSIDYERLFPR